MIQPGAFELARLEIDVLNGARPPCAGRHPKAPRVGKKVGDSSVATVPTEPLSSRPSVEEQARILRREQIHSVGQTALNHDHGAFRLTAKKKSTGIPRTLFRHDELRAKPCLVERSDPCYVHRAWLANPEDNALTEPIDIEGRLAFTMTMKEAIGRRLRIAVKCVAACPSSREFFDQHHNTALTRGRDMFKASSRGESQPMIQRAAPAKLNLYLRTRGQRTDGFHDLDTVMVALDLEDHLEVECAPSLSLASDTGLGLTEDLAGRAALALRADRDLAGAHIRIRKVIPTGGGLGGGSSNAAASLLAMDAFWELNTPFQTLLDLAAQLGSDVPFFLAGQACLAQGRGERLRLIEAPHLKLHGLLLFPDEPIATPTAYGWLDEDGLAEDRTVTADLPALMRAMVASDPKGILAHVHNSFTEPVRRRSPGVARCLDYLEGAGLRTLLCGSGSTVIGLSDEDHRPRQAAPNAPYPHRLVQLMGRFSASDRVTGLPNALSLRA